MAKSRRTYTREFKIEAVKLVTQQGLSVAEAARSLGIRENQLRTWKQALEKESQDGQQAFPGLPWPSLLGSVGHDAGIATAAGQETRPRKHLCLTGPTASCRGCG